jgi:hypothetical protein
MPEPLFDAVCHMASGGDKCPVCGLKGRGFKNRHRMHHTPVGVSPAFILFRVQCDACKADYVQAYRLVSVHPSMPQALAAVTVTEEPRLTVQGFSSFDEFIEALPKEPPSFEAQWNAALLNTPVVDMPEEPDPEIDRSDSEDPDDWTPDAKPTS